ncbi:MAG TPA: malto-oligosyltrehalose synthase, partial [Thermoanaerobaculia bacterium]|nr:malto-oligosyltrehalose synthase [Thermoanaerobaculia bacterium]
KVTGLRIDHIDGLFDPIGYLRKFQLRLGEKFYIVVEKIVERGEELPPEFPVSGTTGYDFLDSLNAVFIDSEGLNRLDGFYRAFTGLTKSFAEVCYEKKKKVIEELFSGEMRTLGKSLSAIAMSDRNARDFAPVDLTAALTEVTACLNVYRTYIRDGPPDEGDRRAIEEALRCAREQAGSSIDYRLFDFLELVLLMNPHPYLESERESWLAFVMRWQQFTGRVMAKGVEDTAFYNYNRLLSLNEVGGDAGRRDFDGLAEFHDRNRRIQQNWPDTLNATSTHDTKRSEDVRARLNVLSEIADVWARQVRRWSRVNASLRPNNIPDANEELMIYQTLVGMWPLNDEELPVVRDRLRQFLEKAAREAKTHTSWITPNPDYEKALLEFGEAILSHPPFCEGLLRFQKRIAFYGAINALSQVVLKAMSPGVPDFYQGTDLWDLSLVDPDNRRAVDYERRTAMLRTLQQASGRRSLDWVALLRSWPSGRLKMFITWKLLDMRARHAEAISRGAYEPLDGGRNVCAFTRGDEVLVAVPRFVTSLVKPSAFPLGDVWKTENLVCPGRWRNVFTGDELESLPLAQVFAKLPVAVFERI